MLSTFSLRVFCVLIFINISAFVHCKPQKPLGKGKFLDQTLIAKLIADSVNSTRAKIVNATLQAAAGVYKDKQRGRKNGLQRTVFTTMIAFNAAGIFHYKVYFQNFLCFARHYDFDIVVYIAHHHLQDVEAEIRSLSRMGVHVLTYPDELFWRLMATKRNNIIPADKIRADYVGTIPTFQNHGALVMLVPVLEVLEHNYNAIFFDVDIGLAQDPVPFLTRGDADFVTSLEPRVCPELYPSFSKSDFNWAVAEPNTGVMHVRATAAGKIFYRKWLEEIIDENVLNDQRVFNPKIFNAIYTPNCNWNLSAVPTIKPKGFDNASYCILPEILFQNGMIAFTCSTKKAHRDDWVIEMSERGTEINGRHFPVSIHANYCNGKSHELDIRGLWLHQYVADMPKNESSVLIGSFDNSTDITDPYAFTCKKYDFMKTYFATLNLTEEVSHIKLKRDAVRAAVVKNGTIIKRVGGDEVFLVDEKGVRHGFPNAETFEVMGYEWGQIRSIPTFVLETIAIGDPLPKKSW